MATHDTSRISAGIVLLVVLLGAMFWSVDARADDIVPPTWPRSHPFATVQDWEFDTPASPLPPDGPLPTVNPGDPFAIPGPGVSWTGDFGGTGLTGYVGSGGSGSYIEFEVPNIVDEEPLKLLHIQINGDWTGAPGPPTVVEVEGIIDDDSLDGTFIDSVEVFPGFHRFEDWEILPNPEHEIILIHVPADAFVNQVVIDTISFPEPASGGLLLLGGLLICRRRRSRLRGDRQ